MNYIDFEGNPVVFETGGFKRSDIRLPVGEMISYPGDGIYCMNPLRFGGTVTENNRIFFSVTLYNSSKTQIYTYRNTASWIYKISAGIVYSYLAMEESIAENIPRLEQGKLWSQLATFDGVPAFIRLDISRDPNADITGLKASYNYISTTAADESIVWEHYIDSGVTGFYRQVSDAVNNNTIASLVNGDDFGRRLKFMMIHELNKSRHAVRLATFNVARYGKYHWYKIKEVMQELGVDICGLQEVTDPLGLDSSGVLSEAMTSWQFVNFSTNGELYHTNNRCMMSTEEYPIISTEEVYYAEQSPSGDHRYYVKTELTMPRYMDKRGSENLKLSIYNTQLEVINNTVCQAQATELAQAVQADPNPFIIVMGDTNDFTIDKKTWETFTNAGLTPVVGTLTSTVAGTTDFNCIDNFFLSRRISALDYDVFNAYNYPWSNGRTLNDTLSDHDIVIADITFDYSDLHTITVLNTNCTHDLSTDWLSDDDTLVINVGAQSGYTLSKVEVRDCMIDITSSVYNNGVITLDGSTLIGDVRIVLRAEQPS